MASFAHQRFEVYGLAVLLMKDVAELAGELPREWRVPSDQLLRAAASIPTNIAEGAGEFSPREKARFYRIARRSAAEVSALLDVLRAVGACAPERVAPLDVPCQRIAAMLTRMAKTQEARARAAKTRTSPSTPHAPPDRRVPPTRPP